jgi:hypothetical protein
MSCRRAWYVWLVSVVASFTYLETRAYQRKCHPTLSRELERWTASKRHRWSPWLFAALGGWLSWHIATLDDLPQSNG